jgi:hypothetical protein
VEAAQEHIKAFAAELEGQVGCARKLVCLDTGETDESLVPTVSGTANDVIDVDMLDCVVQELHVYLNIRSESSTALDLI